MTESQNGSGIQPDDLPIDPDVDTSEPTASLNDPFLHRHAERVALFAISSAGAAGALARYGVSELIATPASGVPWGTFWINISGSFALGLVIVILQGRFPRARLARPLIATGFLGAYTTFSTFTIDIDLLFRAHDLATGVTYGLLSLFAGLLAVFSGIVMGRGIVRWMSTDLLGSHQ